MARTQRERRAETRERLLASAAQLFADHGFDAVSVDAVAEAAGRTSGAVYDHFGSKQGMLLALLDRWEQALVTVMAAEFELASGVEERLRAVVTNLITDPSEETRRLLRLEQELQLRAARHPAVATVLAERVAEAQARMARGFAAWIAEGVIAPLSPPETLATVLRALVVGLEIQHRIDPSTVDVDTATAALGQVLDVVVPSAPRRPPAPTTTTGDARAHRDL
ncbi:MAG TPA: helix-turn-helix domain-containing protein [Acidimicrobiales bacterium]|nr:helix-turn-helix domain-containing protein [Acidimicrobiales bacterium]